MARPSYLGGRYFMQAHAASALAVPSVQAAALIPVAPTTAVVTGPTTDRPRDHTKEIGDGRIPQLAFAALFRTARHSE
jgi:hypothetical protein